MSVPVEHPLLKSICIRAGEKALEYWQTSRSTQKKDGSIVTDADIACESVLVESLSKAFPDCAIISEEGSQRTGSGGTWYVDPIDGTSSFVEGLAHWGPTISLAVDGEFQMGAFWQPRLGEYWFAKSNKGAWNNESEIKITQPDRIRSFHPLYGPSGLHRVGPIPWPGKLRALGSTAAHLALVASTPGSVALVPRWKLWDIGNGILMVEQSGGVLTDLSGKPWHPLRDSPCPILAGSPRAIEHLTTQGSFLNDVR